MPLIEAKPIPSQSLLRKILDYDPQTGWFVWKIRSNVPKRWNTRYAGTAACHVTSSGRVIVNINRIRYKAHRIAWVYMNGPIPDGMHVDHIDNESQICDLQHTLKTVPILVHDMVA